MQIYIHIPFCRHKCPYCDFNSHVRRILPWARYQAALCTELRQRLRRQPWRGRVAETLYFGGGTPSLAPPELIAAVIALLRSEGALTADAEISIEVNPGALDEARLDGWRQAGVNRISIGVQSLDPRQLRWLERIHDAEEAREAVEAVRAGGWRRIGVDLIYGLPEQSLDAWLEELSEVARWPVSHLSCYQLAVEEGTVLAARHAARPYPLPDEEQAASMLQESRRLLRDAGWQPYEISNYARGGDRCRHNDGYWRYVDYLGAGAGAWGKYDLPCGGVRRYGNIRHPERYMAAVESGRRPEQEAERRSRRQAAAEALWLGFRRSDGIDLPAFHRRFGASPHALFGGALAGWLQRGLLVEEATSMRLSEEGLLLADAVAAELLATAADEGRADAPPCKPR
ncbi:MAG: radical SAM family heme chaperone HemW [Zetaproteobacteria bacterium]|nr:MAG: radical SAM family heme chaperone HemW [Zetaproteobacteria bacterium]